MPPPGKQLNRAGEEGRGGEHLLVAYWPELVTWLPNSKDTWEMEFGMMGQVPRSVFLLLQFSL